MLRKVENELAQTTMRTWEERALKPPLIPGLADLPLGMDPDKSDAFGLESQLAAYYHILRHPATETPLSLAIYGKWGMGKSSAMGWLRTNLISWSAHIKAQKDTTHPRIITANFYPWKYKTPEELWRGILAEVILAILEDSKADLPKWKEVRESLKRIAPALGKGFIKAAKLKLGAEAKLEPGEPKRSMFKFGAKADVEFSPQEFLDTFLTNLHPEDKHLNLFEEELKKFVNEALKNNRRLVVFVDDLDRCEPDVAYQMLEAVKLYLNIHGIAFVFGVDEEVLRGHIRKRYIDLGVDQAPTAEADRTVQSDLSVEKRQSAKGEAKEVERKADDYFKKLFNHEVELVRPTTHMRKYVSDMILEVGKSLPGMSDEAHNDSFKRLVAVVYAMAGRNPRQAKRLVNQMLAGGVCAMETATSCEDSPQRFFMGASTYLLQTYLRSKDKGQWLGDHNFEAFTVQWRNLMDSEGEAVLTRNKIAEFKAPDRPAEREYSKQLTDLLKEDVFQEFLHLAGPQTLQDLIRLGAGTPWNLESKKDELTAQPLRNEPDNPIWRAIADVLEVDDPNNIDPERLADIRSLDLRRLPISDISPLAALTQLTSLQLGGNQVSDVSSLAGLSQLQTLALIDTQVTDVSPLAYLTNLTHLSLSLTQVSDLTPLANLSRLMVLDVGYTKVSDASPLAGLTQLNSLVLCSSRVSDVSWAAALTNLTMINLQNTHVSDVSPLAALTKLAILNISGTQVSDASPLAELTALIYLHASAPLLSDASPLARLTSLHQLNLESTRVSDVSPLSRLTQLTQLYLSGSPVSDLSPLAALDNLKYLDLSETQVSDLSSLAGLTEMAELNLTNTRVSDIACLAQLTGLTGLYLGGTQVSDITPLANLIHLTYLNLENTPVSDWSPLESLEKIERLEELTIIR